MVTPVVISADRARLDVDFVHRWLSRHAYWARNVPRAVVDRAVASSVCFGAYLPDGRQVGFARVVTDGATFAWVCDVFVVDSERGRGTATRLVRAALAHPDVHGVRRVLLATADAHDLYRRLGFRDVDTGRFLEIASPPEDLWGPARPVLGAARAEPPEMAGRWEFPGGKVERGETDPTLPPNSPG